jgi:hypothetical protein
VDDQRFPRPGRAPRVKSEDCWLAPADLITLSTRWTALAQANGFLRIAGIWAPGNFALNAPAQDELCQNPSDRTVEGLGRLIFI